MTIKYIYLFMKWGVKNLNNNNRMILTWHRYSFQKIGSSINKI